MEKYYREFDFTKKIKKTENPENLKIINVEDYNMLTEYNYTIKELHDISKRLNIKIKKNKKKKEMLNILINTLFLYSKIKIIQKCWKNYFIKCFNETLGPCYRNNKLSNNIEDFLTTEKINEIDYYYFFSYKDEDNFYYTFNLASLSILLSKGDDKNPYTRIKIPPNILKTIDLRMRFNKILNKTSEISNYEQQPLTLNQKIMNLFHKIDLLGNYTQSSWFLELNSLQILKFIRELYDIWIYRAQLSTETKIKICPPNGNPFYNVSPGFLNHSLQLNNIGIEFLKRVSFVIMNRLVNSANNNDDKNMGALYVLSALTLVSDDARDAMPWLYASVY